MTHWRRGIAALSLVLVAALGLWWLQQEPPVPSTQGTRAEPPVPHLEPMPLTEVQPSVEASPQSAPVRFVVRPGDHRTWVHSAAGSGVEDSFAMRPVSIPKLWSIVPDLVLPEGTEALRGFLPRDEGAGAVADGLEAGLLFADGRPTPGEALVEARLLDLWVDVAHDEAVAAYRARHAIPGDDAAPAERREAMARARAVEPWPSAPTTEALERLATLVDAVDGDVRDVLDLTRLELLAQHGDGKDPEAALDLTLHLASEAGDPRVQDAAVELLANARLEDLHVPADVLDAFADLYDDGSSRVYPISLADFGATAAAKLGDADRLQPWLARFRAGIDTTCEGMSEGLRTSVCPRMRHRADVMEAVGLATSDRDPATWQAGVMALAHQCGMAHAAGDVLEGEAVFDAGWSWRFAAAGSRADCITSGPVRGPAPPSGQRVELVVLPTR